MQAVIHTIYFGDYDLPKILRDLPKKHIDANQAAPIDYSNWRLNLDMQLQVCKTAKGLDIPVVKSLAVEKIQQILIENEAFATNKSEKSETIVAECLGKILKVMTDPDDPYRAELIRRVRSSSMINGDTQISEPIMAVMREYQEDKLAEAARAGFEDALNLMGP